VGRGFIPPDPRGELSDRHPTVRSKRRERKRAVGHLGLGRKRERQRLSATLCATRKRKVLGHRQLRARLFFVIIFYRTGFN
jgi:hypothetical protein